MRRTAPVCAESGGHELCETHSTEPCSVPRRPRRVVDKATRLRRTLPYVARPICRSDLEPRQRVGVVACAEVEARIPLASKVKMPTSPGLP